MQPVANFQLDKTYRFEILEVELARRKLKELKVLSTVSETNVDKILLWLELEVLLWLLEGSCRFTVESASRAFKKVLILIC